MTDTPAFDTPNQLYRYQRQCVAVAMRMLGRGEDPLLGNNRGDDVDEWRREDGVRDADLYQTREGGAGSWCATVRSCIDTRAAFDLAMVCPHLRYRGSKTLARSVEAAGGIVQLRGDGKERVEGELVIHGGEWIVWDRGLLSAPVDPSGHTALGLRYVRKTDTLVTLEGNHDNATYRGDRYALFGMFIYPDGQWRNRLDTVVGYIPPDAPYIPWWKGL